MDILAMAGSLLGGAQLGAIGVVANGVLDLFHTKQKNKHELEMLQMKMEILKAEGSNAINLENIKVFGAASESDKLAYAVNKPSGWTGLFFDFLMTIVDFMRGFTRPGLTWYYTIAATSFCAYAFKRVGVDDALLHNIVSLCISGMLEMAGISGTYWFGTRGLQILRGKI